MKLEHFLTLYTKINSKFIKDLNVRPETINLLEETIGRTLDDINQSKILYDPPPREMEIKTKGNKWDLIKRNQLEGAGGSHPQGHWKMHPTPTPASLSWLLNVFPSTAPESTFHPC